MKSREMVEKLLERTASFSGGSILEVGIAYGGSTAMLAKLLRPRKLVAIERGADAIPTLEAFIEEQGLADVVRTFYGVDQRDRENLAAIVDEEFEGPIDLIIDDASHLYQPTRNSFEELFPRLREGGIYMIEDWRWEHLGANLLASVWSGPGAVEPAGVTSEEERAPMRMILNEVDDANADYAMVLRDLISKYGVESGPSDTQVSTGSAISTGENHARKSPLTSLVLQLIILQATAHDIIRDITVDEHWVAVRRGSEPLDRATFSAFPDILDCFGQFP